MALPTKLILRSKDSPFNGQFSDVNKGSTLSNGNLDDNQIYLKGNIIYTATTNAGNLILNKINGESITVGNLGVSRSSADTILDDDRTHNFTGKTEDFINVGRLSYTATTPPPSEASFNWKLASNDFTNTGIRVTDVNDRLIYALVPSGVLSVGGVPVSDATFGETSSIQSISETGDTASVIVKGQTKRVFLGITPNDARIGTNGTTKLTIHTNDTHAGMVDVNGNWHFSDNPLDNFNSRVGIQANGPFSSDYALRIKTSNKVNDILNATGDGQVWANGFGYDASSTKFGRYVGLVNGTTQNTQYGYQSGQNNFGDQTTQIGVGAGENNLSDNVVQVGYGAGGNNIGVLSTQVGSLAGLYNVGDAVVQIGHQAGENNNGGNAVHVGFKAGQNNSGVNTVLVGTLTGFNQIGSDVAAVGYAAAANNKGSFSVMFGSSAGNKNENGYLVAVGYGSASNYVSERGVLVGYNSGNNAKGADLVGMGSSSALYSNGVRDVFVGSYSGYHNNWSDRTHLGYSTPDADFIDNVSTTYGFADTDFSGNTLSATPHNFGATGDFVNLRFNILSGAAPNGLSDGVVHQFTIVDSNTLSRVGMSSNGTGTYSLVKDVDRTNSISVGSNSIATSDNQVRLGNTGTTHVYIEPKDQATISSIANPTKGMLAIDDSDGTIAYYDGTEWIFGCCGASGQASGNIGIQDSGGTYTYYATLQEAHTAALSGDVVEVWSQYILYDNTGLVLQDSGFDMTTLNLWKDGVTWYFHTGVTIEFKNDTNGGSQMDLFRPSPDVRETCTVVGDLVFKQSAVGADTGGGQTYFYHGRPDGTDVGFEFRAETYHLTTTCNAVIDTLRNPGNTGLGDVTIITKKGVLNQYDGGSVLSGGGIVVFLQGGENRIYLDVGDYVSEDRFGFYLRGDMSGDTVTIKGRDYVNTHADSLCSFYTKSLSNATNVIIDFDRYYISNGFAPFLAHGALLAFTENSNNNNIKIKGDVYEGEGDHSGFSVFSSWASRVDVSFIGDIYLNNNAGVGMGLLVNTNHGSNSGSVYSIKGDVHHVGSGTYTRTLFQPTANVTVKYEGNMDSTLQGVVASGDGFVEINNSTILLDAVTTTAQLVNNNNTTKLNLKLRNSVVQTNNSTLPTIDADYTDIQMVNSVINNLNGGGIIGTVGTSYIQMLNSTVISTTDTITTPASIEVIVEGVALNNTPSATNITGNYSVNSSLKDY